MNLIIPGIVFFIVFYGFFLYKIMYKIPLKSAKPFDCKLNTHLSKKHRISLVLDMWSVNLFFTTKKDITPKGLCP